MKDHLKEIKDRLEKSNANLIAHAPSDLDKLVKVVELYEEALEQYAHSNDGGSKITFHRSDFARQTLAKAKEIMGDSDN